MTEAAAPRLTDFTTIKEGGVEPNTGKTVTHLVRARHDFIVFLDEEGDVWWWVNPGTHLTPEAGRLLGRLDLLANDPLTGVPDAVRKELRRHMAGVIADIYDWPDVDPRCAVRVASYVARAKANVVRQWVVEGALMSTFACLFIGYLATFLWEPLNVGLGPFSMLLSSAALAGAFGALASMLQRSGELRDDPTGITRRQYQLDGLARVVAGAISGGFVAALMEADMMLGFVDGLTSGDAVFLVLGFMAGFSERWVPSLVERLVGENGGSQVTSDAPQVEMIKTWEGMREEGDGGQAAHSHLANEVEDHGDDDELEVELEEEDDAIEEEDDEAIRRQQPLRKQAT